MKRHRKIAARLVVELANVLEQLDREDLSEPEIDALVERRLDLERRLERLKVRHPRCAAK